MVYVGSGSFQRPYRPYPDPLPVYYIGPLVLLVPGASPALGPAGVVVCDSVLGTDWVPLEGTAAGAPPLRPASLVLGSRPASPAARPCVGHRHLPATQQIQYRCNKD